MPGMNTADCTVMVYFATRGSGRGPNLCHMLATVVIRGISLDRHEPPDAGSVERDARRSNGRAPSVSRVEAIEVPAG